LTTAEAHPLRDRIVAVIDARGWNRIALDLDRLRDVLNRIENYPASARAPQVLRRIFARENLPAAFWARVCQSGFPNFSPAFP
jgi:hypothetical protein